MVELPMKVRVERRYNQAAAVFCGPLLYSLNVSATTTKLPYCSTGPGSSGDGSKHHCKAGLKVEQSGYSYQNASAWNYALDASSLSFEQVLPPPPYHGLGYRDTCNVSDLAVV